MLKLGDETPMTAATTNKNVTQVTQQHQVLDASPISAGVRDFDLSSVNGQQQAQLRTSTTVNIHSNDLSNAQDRLAEAKKALNCDTICQVASLQGTFDSEIAAVFIAFANLLNLDDV